MAPNNNNKRGAAPRQYSPASRRSIQQLSSPVGGRRIITTPEKLNTYVKKKLQEELEKAELSFEKRLDEIMDERGIDGNEEASSVKPLSVRRSLKMSTGKKSARKGLFDSPVTGKKSARKGLFDSPVTKGEKEGEFTKGEEDSGVVLQQLAKGLTDLGSEKYTLGDAMVDVGFQLNHGCSYDTFIAKVVGFESGFVIHLGPFGFLTMMVAMGKHYPTTRTNRGGQIVGGLRVALEESYGRCVPDEAISIDEWKSGPLNKFLRCLRKVEAIGHHYGYLNQSFYNKKNELNERELLNVLALWHEALLVEGEVRKNFFLAYAGLTKENTIDLECTFDYIKSESDRSWYSVPVDFASSLNKKRHTEIAKKNYEIQEDLRVRFGKSKAGLTVSDLEKATGKTSWKETKTATTEARTTEQDKAWEQVAATLKTLTGQVSNLVGDVRNLKAQARRQRWPTKRDRDAEDEVGDEGVLAKPASEDGGKQQGRWNGRGRGWGHRGGRGFGRGGK